MQGRLQSERQAPPAQQNAAGLLACPVCGGSVEVGTQRVRCGTPSCRSAFPVVDGIPVMLPDQADRQGGGDAGHAAECPPPSAGAGRYELEKAKWNRRSADLLREGLPRQAPEDYDRVFRGRSVLAPVHRHLDPAGKTVLECGCGTGWTTVLLAQKAGQVMAFDIAINSVRVLCERVRRLGLDNVSCCVADAEHLPFRGEVFDVVFGNAVLHHVRLPLAVPETARVMKPGGRGAFCEPLAHNPLVNACRYVKHHWLDEYEGTDRPLRYADRAVFADAYSRVQYVESSLLRDRVGWLRELDRRVMSVGALRRLAAYVAVLLEK